jgi:hypothetical protein
MASPNPVEAPRTYFTVEKANKALPLVRAIVADIVRQWRAVSELERGLEPFMKPKRKAVKQEPFSEEVAQRQNQLEEEQAKLREYVDELEKLGVEIKSIQEGLCDFPCLLDGREVLLCWKLGEPQVQFWHEVDAGFGGRKPITGRKA